MTNNEQFEQEVSPTNDQQEDNVEVSVVTVNEEATKYSHEYGNNKSPVSQARKDSLKRPAHVIASQEEIEGYKALFYHFFEVLVYFGISLIHGYPSGVFVGVIYPKGKGGSIGKGEAFFIHEAEGNPRFVNEIEAKLVPISKTINREMIENMIRYAVEMKKTDQYTEITEDELNALLADTLGSNDAARRFHVLETEMISDPELFASLSQQNYNKDIHSGILLDTNKMKRKFGDYAVGIHRKLLLSVFCGGDIDDDEEDVDLRANNSVLNVIVGSWKKEGFLAKRTEVNRLNEKINGLNADNASERFYVVRSEKLYKAWAEFQAEEEGIDNE